PFVASISPLTWSASCFLCRSSATTETYTLSLHDALPIYATENMLQWFVNEQVEEEETAQGMIDSLKLIGTNGFGIYTMDKELAQDRKSTRLNSSHVKISYAVFCLKKKKKK